MEPIIDHIELTVKDMAVAVPFYDKLLPLLGFDIRERVDAVIEKHEKHVVQYTHPRLGFAITSPRSGFASETIHRRRPGALHHLAFKAESRAEVDRLYQELKRIGATIVSPPRSTRNILLLATMLCTSKIRRGSGTRLSARITMGLRTFPEAALPSFACLRYGAHLAFPDGVSG